MRALLTTAKQVVDVFNVRNLQNVLLLERMLNIWLSEHPEFLIEDIQLSVRDAQTTDPQGVNFIIFIAYVELNDDSGRLMDQLIPANNLGFRLMVHGAPLPLKQEYRDFSFTKTHFDFDSGYTFFMENGVIVTVVQHFVAALLYDLRSRRSESNRLVVST